MAVMAVSCAGGATLSESNIITVADDTRVLDVGTSSLINEDKWTGDITVGDYGESKGTVDAIGYVSSDELVPSSSLNGSTYTDRIYVTGNVTLQGNGKIILGGRNATTSSKMYGGIRANSITVGHEGEESDSPTFFASMTEIDTLTINSGTVTLGAGSDCYTGNSQFTENSRKMAQVKTELNVHGGNVVFGQEHGGNYNNEHCQSALGYQDKDQMSKGYIFKGATVNQTKGTLNFIGYTLVANGLKINQTGGEMIFSDPMAFQANKGWSPLPQDNNTISQNGTADTKLVINGMKDALHEPPSTMVTNFIQQGAGTIELKGDVNYTTDGVNTITQEGDSTTGKFNVQADCSSVDFSLQQKATGATINVLGKMDIVDSSIHGTLHVGHDATLNVQGELTVEGTATLNFGVNSADNDYVAMKVVDGGNIAALGAAVSLTLTEALTTKLDEYFTSEKVGDKTMTFNLISNFDADQLDNLTEGDIFTTPAAVATLATDDIAYEVKDWSLSVTDNNVLQATVTWQAVTAGEQIPEPATATLGLLALAGLAARRRRASR